MVFCFGSLAWNVFVCCYRGQKGQAGAWNPHRNHIACGLASAVVISGWPAIRRSSIYDGFGLRSHQLQDFIPWHFWHVWEVPVQDFHSPWCSMMLRISYNSSRFNRFTLASLLRSLDHRWVPWQQQLPAPPRSVCSLSMRSWKLHHVAIIFRPSAAAPCSVRGWVCVLHGICGFCWQVMPVVPY